MWSTTLTLTLPLSLSRVSSFMSEREFSEKIQSARGVSRENTEKKRSIRLEEEIIFDGYRVCYLWAKALPSQWKLSPSFLALLLMHCHYWQKIEEKFVEKTNRERDTERASYSYRNYHIEVKPIGFSLLIDEWRE